MNANPRFDALVGVKTSVPLRNPALDLDCASHCLDDAAKLDHRPVAGALDELPVMHRDGGVDEIAAQRSQAGESALLVGSRQSAVTDNVGDEDRGDLSARAHASFYAVTASLRP